MKTHETKADRPAVDFLESAPISPFVEVALAGSGPGELHAALARANEVGRSDAAELLDSWLPETPHDDRRRTDVAPVVGEVGGTFTQRVTGDDILGLLGTIDASSNQVALQTRGADGVERLPIEDFRMPSAGRGVRPLNLGKVMRRLEDDATVQLMAVDLLLPDLARLAEAAERTTGAHVSITAFVSAGVTAGLGRHADLGEMWIIQLEGSKHWTMWTPTIEFYDHRREAPGFGPIDEVLDVNLTAGKTLVVPRSYLHKVDPSGELTVALSVLIKSPSRAELHETYLASVGGESAWLEPIHAAGPTPSAPSMGVGVANFDARLQGEVARFRASLPPRHVVAAPALVRACATGTVDQLVLRSALGGGVHPVEDAPSVITIAGGRRIMRLTRRCLPAVEHVFSGRPFTVDQLPWSGSREESTALVTRLIGEGVVGLATE